MSLTLKDLEYDWGLSKPRHGFRFTTTKSGDILRYRDCRLQNTTEICKRWDDRCQKRREKKAREALKQPDILLDDF